MNTLSVTYPATPENIDQSILQPSSAFKQDVFKVLTAIVFFIAVYFVMVAAAIGLAVLCAFGGFALIVAKPMFLTLMVGLGLVGLGVMVVFFLFKFLFKSNKTDRSGLIEISEADQPQLFQFVRNLTKETQTPFPKKIYLSHEVNASVFYDSSFWSMFLPVRKNLLIGLGLVNAVNISEFKAILAHEFGHFSQRSMKLGSYVYNMNRVIYNLLYDNDGYGRTLESWANVSGYFAFFAGITVKIVQGIQWVLQKVYGIVNKSYMSLSRQMEFHADTVAAYVSGSDHLISSLRRLEVADVTFNNLFEYYNRFYKEGLKPDNLYPQHTEVMRQYARQHNITFQHELPVVDASTFSRFNKARIVVKDQWASHPSTDDREAHLRSLNVRTSTLQLPAWSIFKDAENLQKQVTEKVYEQVKFETQPQALAVASFRDRYEAQVTKYELDSRYKTFYDYRNISVTELRGLENKERVTTTTLNDLLTEEVLSVPHVIEGIKSDIHTLEAIGNGNLPVKGFEFNGRKYRSRNSDLLITDLKKELQEAEAKLVQSDARVIAFFLNAAERHGQKEQLREKYSELFQVSASSDEDMKNYVTMMQDVMPIYHGNLQLEEVKQIMEKVKLNEVLVKDRLGKLVNDPACVLFISEAEKARVNEYLAKDHVYFRDVAFDQDALELFNENMNLYYTLFSEWSFMTKKKVLEFQLRFLN
jgi:Zn-dependent protease with chaperone function